MNEIEDFMFSSRFISQEDVMSPQFSSLTSQFLTNSLNDST